MGKSIRIFLLTCIFLAFSNLMAQGQQKTMHLFGLVGLSSQELSGVDGINVSRINQASYMVAFHYVPPSGFVYGIQYSTVPAAKIKTFTFHNRSEGSYTLNFERYELVFGITRFSFHFDLLAGMNTVGWKGSPQLGHEPEWTMHYGGQFGFNLSQIGTSPLKVPILVQLIYHSERKQDFKNFPDDSVTISTGGEFAFYSGVCLEF